MNSGNNSMTTNIQLWVRSEPLTYGILHVNPHPRLLSLHNIKKLVSYAKGKGKSGYPKLSYPIWKHIACNKLQLTENLAWTLFHTCIVMSTGNPGKLKSLESKLFACEQDEETERVRASQSIDLLKFVLFLYIQQINKISLRANAASPNAEWPEARKSMDSDVCKSDNKNMDEVQHLQFVLQNISEILDILSDPGTFESSGSSKIDTFLSVLSIEALNLIIEGRTEKSGNVKPLSEIVQSQGANQSKLGLSKTTRFYDVRLFTSWLRSNLGGSPFGLEACMSQGKRLAWGSGSRGRAGDDPGWRQQARRQKVATTANLLPRDCGKGNKIILISSIYNQTIARSSGSLEQSTLRIHRCYFSYLYFLSPLRCVSVEKCRKTTICVGPVENTLQLIGCEDCVVVAPVRRLVLVGCRRCTIYCLAGSTPLLCQGASGTITASMDPSTGAVSSAVPTSRSGSLRGGATGGSAGTDSTSSHHNLQGPNEDICFAPYCAYYPTLEQHLNITALDPAVNFWNVPVPLGGSTHDPCWELLPPADFYPITIPFEMEGSTTGCPVPWPSVYQEALRQRSQRYESLRAFIKNSKLTPDQNRYFRNLVEKRFRSWLTESDEYRQLILLDPNSGSVASSTGSGGSTMPQAFAMQTNNAAAPATVGGGVPHASTSAAASVPINVRSSTDDVWDSME